jgi:predicted DCC family thiol-disulfide oxidoreductase YuxK
MKSQQKLKVYYDGLCKVCSREIEHYRKQIGANGIEFIDICASGFDATKEGLDPVQVHKVMHVRRQDGSLAVKVDAFIEIWKTLPRYRFLLRVVNYPGVRTLLDLGYHAFSIIRPVLPRYSAQADCQDSPYCEVKNV